jgi:hypothetical protein
VRIVSFVRQHWLFIVLLGQILFIAFASGYLLSTPWIEAG